jgi:hypothetical protein
MPANNPTNNAKFPYLNYVAIIGIVGLIIWQFVLHLL